jgi:thiamine-phosphate pyrophosphorylase
MGYTGNVMTNEGRIFRIIDANVNRAVEGLRVVEEIARFILEDKKLTGQLKAMRAQIRRAKPPLSARGSESDVGRKLYHETEADRQGLLDIFTANIKRAQEALRVLEEYTKLIDPKHGAVYKECRFKVYDLEKALFPKLAKLEKLDFDLYLVTDPMRDHIKATKLALAGGVKAIQLRDKTASKAQLLKWAKQIVKMTRKAGATFIVNDYADVAKASGAEGVHVGQDTKNIAQIRKELGPDKIIGVSAANLAQALKAERTGADYVAVGPVFATPIKANIKPVGLNVLRTIVKRIKVPVVAIGGIDQNNTNKVLATGCQRIAVIRAILQSPDPRRSAIRLGGGQNART